MPASPKSSSRSLRDDTMRARIPAPPASPNGDDPYFNPSGRSALRPSSVYQATVTDEDAERRAEYVGGPPFAPAGATSKNGPATATGPGVMNVLNLGRGEDKLIFAVVALAFVVRLWKIDWPNSVVFDEVHFGGFASKYIKRHFFMDVHPPLAKLLITLAGWLSGFDGNFDFKDIGNDYVSAGVPYISMRLLPALLGIALVPLTYLTLRMFSCRATTAMVGGLLITFENGLVTQSRFILLDSPLLFFTALTVFAWVGFSNEERKGSFATGGQGTKGVAAGRDGAPLRGPFSKPWWAWLSLTGASLGAVVSCKWVGLFTISTVGFATIAQLWRHLGDLRLPPRILFKHFSARVLCLIILPLSVYMSIFGIHFALLAYSGEGDGFMSSAFQHTLRGHGMDDTFADVAMGSNITLRHLNTQGGYLHSHTHQYPAGSHQQQVTLYPHSDENNVWQVLNATDFLVEHPDLPYTRPDEPIHLLRHKQEIRLKHVMTTKNLHSHDGVRPPITETDFQNEVTGYGFDGFDGDANDNFIVEVEDGGHDDGKGPPAVKAIRTKIRLRHTLTGCYLFSHKIALPDWGFGQQEVTCNKNPTRPGTIWYIETNEHAGLPEDAPKVNYVPPSFFTKFFELQAVMWQTNAGLIDRHAYDSRPPTWPVLRRGINFWNKDKRQVYLIGNPFIWWGSTAAILVYAAAKALLLLRAKRGYSDFNDSTIVFYDSLCSFLAIGWALHYLPFYFMNRQLFLHHYLPALYFAILLLCALFDFATAALRPRIRLQIAAVVVIIATLCWWKFAPLTYAGQWTQSGCHSAKWMKSWDFACNEFPTSYDAYHSLSSKSNQAVPSTPVAVGPGSKDGEKLLGASVLGDGGSTTSSVIVDPVEPGRNVFDKGDVRVAQSSARKLDPPVQAKQKQPEGQSQSQSQSQPQQEQQATGAGTAVAASSEGQGMNVAKEEEGRQLGGDMLEQVVGEGTATAKETSSSSSSSSSNAATRAADSAEASASSIDPELRRQQIQAEAAAAEERMGA